MSLTIDDTRGKLQSIEYDKQMTRDEIIEAKRHFHSYNQKIEYVIVNENQTIFVLSEITDLLNKMFI